MSRKLAAIANLKRLSLPRKAVIGLGGMGAAGLGIKNYLDSFSMPPTDELLMMDLPEIPEDKSAALVNDIPRASTQMLPAPMPRVPTPRVEPSGETSNPFSKNVSVTGNTATSQAGTGVKNASFLGGGLLPAAAGGVGGYLIGEHLIAPHFVRQQAAIAEQIAQGQTAMAAAARNSRISPILAAAAGALLLSWLLSDSGKKREEIKGYTGGLQGFNPEDQQAFSADNHHHNMGM